MNTLLIKVFRQDATGAQNERNDIWKKTQINTLLIKVFRQDATGAQNERTDTSDGVRLSPLLLKFRLPEPTNYAKVAPL